MNRCPRVFTRRNLARLPVLAVCLLLLALLLVLPQATLLSKALTNRSGEFVGLANYVRYFNNPNLATSVANTLDISIWSTLISVSCAFLYAYALSRTRIQGKALFRCTALIPIFLPTIVHALGLVYLFGRQGLLTRAGLFDGAIYGRLGIILAEVIFTFPQAYLMLSVALEYSDGRLYEAADSMAVSGFRKLIHITLPEISYSLVNTFFVCFTLSFTDFGAPKVIGGSYNVLATDIYKLVVGQFDMNMGAVVATLLLIPALLSFVADRLLSGKNSAVINARATRLNIKPNLLRDLFFQCFCLAVSLFFLSLIAALAIGAFSTYYPYDLAPTLENFIFNPSAGGIRSYFNSLLMALLTAGLGTLFIFVYAYVMEKTEAFKPARRLGSMLAVVPLALPGMVIGLAFIFFFNARQNPLHFIYGTVLILVLSNILHYFSVPYLTAVGALKKLDREYESTSDSLGVPRLKAFFAVSVPLSLPAILEIFMYLFVNAMVTVSAVVFLYSANFKIAAIAISHMEEAGDIGQAAAMSLLILLVNVVVRVLYEVSIYLIGRKP